ncbi:MAG: ATP-binding cassette domain-containing protein [Clostridiaceae bacterium]|jgi:cell division transport system ATP-binding protein|nr:ATP-binding cassette domain-containing protein [Clostridiaceae bacterium]
MIEVKDVSLRYRDGTLALNNINLTIGESELVYLTGPSGSGKTSLLKLIMGMEYPTSGIVRVMGQSIPEEKPEDLRNMRKRIGPVFQELKLVPGRSAMENVLMGIRFLDFSRQEIKENAADALEKVGLAHKADSMVENLSWGEAQRVAIARAIARKPGLILADEPTGNLDHDNAVNILNILASFRQKNTSVIVATHATHLIENQRNITIIRMSGGNLTVEKRGGEK